MKKFLPFILALCSLPAWASWGTPVVTSGACSTGTTCAITPAATTAGDLLEVIVTTSSQSITLSSVTGRGAGNSPYAAWYIVSGGGGITSNIGWTSTTGGSIMQAYVYASTGGAGAITATLSGSATTPEIFVIDEPYTNGPIWQSENPQSLAQSAGTTITGAAFHPIGQSNFCMQGIQAAQNVSSINTASGYTITTVGHASVGYLANTIVGTAPVWTLASSGVGGVTGICFYENAGTLQLNNTGGAAVNNLNAQWFAKSARESVSSQPTCYNPSQLALTSAGLTVTTVAGTPSCSDIDFNFGTASYLSGDFLLANTSFLYGAGGGIGNTLYCGTTCTIDIVAKLCTVNGGGTANASGCAMDFYLFDGTCQNSYPTGTDNGCFGVEEIDMVEVGTTFTIIQQQIITTAGGSQGGSQTISDSSLNWHKYTLTWASGTISFKVDGVTGTTVTNANVPSRAMMFQMNQYAGGSIGGTVNNATLPWVTIIKSIKVTNASGVVISNDDFTPSTGGH